MTNAVSSDAQRAFIADAAARGITLVELMREFEKSDLRQTVYEEMYPRPARVEAVPISECPVMAAVLTGLGCICNYEGHSISDHLGRFISDPRGLAPSTMEQQYERAIVCARWFRATVLTLVGTDHLQVPAGDIANACKPLFEALIEEQGPVRIAAATFDSTLAILNTYGTECARQNMHSGQSNVRLMMRSALSDLWLKLFPWIPEGEREPIGGHVHPDGDLDRALTLAEAVAGVGPVPDETDSGFDPYSPELLAALDAAELAAGIMPTGETGTFIPAGDMSPGGVLKK